MIRELGKRARRARDFYAELIQTSQSRRTAFLAERERWLRGVRVDGREELLFELEMLLRGVERYFNLHNLPLRDNEPVVTRDFRAELTDVRDVLSRAILIARQLLDPGSDQKMVFRRYVETQLADDRVRRVLIEDELDQDSPQESLFVLREGFVALRDVLDQLLSLPVCSYALFGSVGDLALRDVVLNRYFRPFRSLEFRLEYDRIKSVAMLEGLRSLPEPERAPFAVVTLSLFRLLHYLSYARNPEYTGRLRVVLALVRSEAVSLTNYLSTDFLTATSSRRQQAFALRSAKELRTRTELIADSLVAADVPGALRCAEAYTDLFRAQVERTARFLQPDITEKPSFARLIDPRALGARLRLDLWGFSGLCRAVEGRLLSDSLEAAESGFSALRDFISYFQGVSYQLLRFGDIEPFDDFIGIVTELGSLPKGPVLRARLAEDCRIFADVAQATFSAVNRRADLEALPFDAATGRDELAKLWRA